MNRDQDPDYQFQNGPGLFDSDEERTQIPTQVQTMVEGSGSIRVSDYNPAPDVDYLQVSFYFLLFCFFIQLLQQRSLVILFHFY